MARVKVTEPITGTEVEVEDDSPQARTWGKSKSTQPKKTTKSSDSK